MKKILSAVLAIAMMFAIIGQNVFAAIPEPVVPEDYVGMSIAYRVVNNSYIALDFRFHGDDVLNGNNFATSIKMDTTKLQLCTPSGVNAIGISQSLQGMPIGYVDGTGEYSDVLNTDSGVGWGSMLQGVSSGGGYRISIALNTDIDVLNYYKANGGIVDEVYNSNTMGDEWQIIPKGDAGLGLYTIYVKPKAGFTLADISQDSFSLYNGGTDSVNGAAFINHGQIVNGNAIWVNFPHKIVASAGAGGTISPVGTKYYEKGTSQDYTITAGADKVIDFVTVNGERLFIPANQTSYVYTFVNIAEDQTIHAAFKANDGSEDGKVYHTINATATQGGTISPSGSTAVLQGDNATFNIAPKADATIVDVLVDGVSQGSLTTYTFTNVTADHTIHAIFKDSVAVVAPATQFTVNAITDSGADIVPIGKTKYDKGSEPAYKITVKPGYTLDAVRVNGIDETLFLVGDTYTFQALNDDAILEVSTILGAPVVTYPTNNATLTDNTPTFVVQAVTGATAVEVTVENGSGIVDSGAATYNSTTLKWEFTSTVLADGTDYIVTAKQTDLFGKASPDSVAVPFKIQTTVAAPTITAPVEGSTTNDKTPTIVVDNTSADVTSVSVTITTKDGTPVETGAATKNGTTGLWEYTPTVDLGDGEYKVTATQTTSLGLTSDPSTVVNFAVKTVVAAPVITAPLNDFKTQNKQQPITGTCEANATVTVTIYDKDSAVVSTGAAVVVGTTWTYTPAAQIAVDGRYTAKAVQTDFVGNVSVESNEGSFVLKTSIAEPTIDNLTGEFTSTKPIITGTGEPGATITINVLDPDGNDVTVPYPVEVIVDEDGTWSYTFDGDDQDLIEGNTYTVKVTQEDAWGNESNEVDEEFIVNLTKYYDITGYVYYDGYNVLNQQSATVELFNMNGGALVATTTASVFTDAGKFKLSHIDERETYKMVIKKKNHATVIVQNITFAGKHISYKQANKFVLLAGNMDSISDNEINVLDRSLLLDGYMKSSPSYVAYDLNDDGEVNALDKSLMVANFYKKAVVIEHAAVPQD